MTVKLPLAKHPLGPFELTGIGVTTHQGGYPVAVLTEGRPSPTVHFKRRALPVSWAIPRWDRAVSRRAGPNGQVRQLKELSEAQRRGLRYEAAVTARLEGELEGQFISQLPFEFRTELTISTAIPDGIILSVEKPEVIVVEIKVSHSADALAQLEFYRGIVAAAFRLRRVRMLAIVQMCEPWTRLPRKFDVVNELSDALHQENEYLVLVWRRP